MAEDRDNHEINPEDTANLDMPHTSADLSGFDVHLNPYDVPGESAADALEEDTAFDPALGETVSDLEYEAESEAEAHAAYDEENMLFEESSQPEAPSSFVDPDDEDASNDERVDAVEEGEADEEAAIPKGGLKARLAGFYQGKRRKLKLALTGVAGVCLVGLIVVAGICVSWLQNLPDYSDADAFNTIKPTEVYASDRTTLIARFQLENRIPLTSLDQISAFVVEGTVATEDERFYKHSGFDLIGIGRAVVNNMTGGTLEGASTITQQLVRNTVLADEMTDLTYKRKVREIFLATQMENLFSKEEILLLYLNTINYGGGAYGIEAAAQRYFSKSATELTLNEAATLIGIPQSPTYNCPLYYPENTKNRRNIVLDRMVRYGCITQEEADAAKAEEIVLNTSDISMDGFILYPYFGSYVRDQLLGSYDLDTATLFQGGLTVYTTLDIPTQQLAEEVVDENEAKLNSALSIAMTCVDPDTGFVKAMVGGKDFYANQWNLAAQAKRQPGSSFKTFTLVTALEQGISPSTSVSCSAGLELNGYKVENYGGSEYGVRTIAGAFAVSSNTGFVRICAAVGPENVVEMAHRLGITSELDPVMSVTLGSEEVTTLEMAGAYATIANGGVRHETVVIEQVIDRDGNVIIDHTKSEGERAISQEVACAAIDVMKGVVSGGTGTRARLTNGQPVAGKTGTSENSKDSWFVGITPQLSVAVWIGDPENRRSVSGLNGAAVFGFFMNRWLADKEIEDFPSADSPSYTRKFSNTDLDVPGIKSTKDPNDAPDLKGMTIEQAIKLLKDEYKYTSSEEYDDTVPAGSVIGQRVEGNKLVIIVSKGPDPAKQEEEQQQQPQDGQEGGNQGATPPSGGDIPGGDGGEEEDPDPDPQPDPDPDPEPIPEPIPEPDPAESSD